ncbi:hypothetical protein NBRC116583_30770 [Arenicella sp. 4NH20-0111]|uniref:hypothetical protein n=1 Tax=Arenicella sp. 4NH20-0111 TaxID=3127648 RepID=UPI0031065416
MDTLQRLKDILMIQRALVTIFAMLNLATNSYAETDRGLVDPTFSQPSNGFGLLANVDQVIELKNKKLLVAGAIEADEGNGLERKNLLRLNSDGSLDSTFNQTTINKTFFSVEGLNNFDSLLEYDDESIILTGTFQLNQTFAQTPEVPNVLRMNSDGTYNANSSFNQNLSQYIVKDVSQGNGILIKGLMNDGRVVLGSKFPDSPFTINTASGPKQVASAFIQPDGSVIEINVNNSYTRTRFVPNVSGDKILMIGAGSDGREELTLLNSNLTVDQSFSHTAKYRQYIQNIRFDNNNNIYFTAANSDGTVDKHIYKILPTGDVDRSFNQSDIGRFSGRISDLEVLPNGKVLVAKIETNTLFLTDPPQTDTTYSATLFRLNKDGSLDVDFNRETRNDYRQFTVGITPQKDGRPIVFTRFPFHSGKMIERTGCVDTSPVTQALDAVADWCSGGPEGFSSFIDSSLMNQTVLQSGELSDDESSWVSGRFNFPGELTFSWKVSSETSNDYLRILVDGQEVDRISGEIGWTQRTVSLTNKNSLVRWEYIKDDNSQAGLDRGFIGNINYAEDKPEELNCSVVKNSLGKIAPICI